MIHVLNRKSIIKLLAKGSLPSNCIIFSFHDSDKKPINGLNDQNSIVLCVDDLQKGDESRGIVFSKLDASKILRKMFPFNQDTEFICQCEAGLSRSAGCAMAIHELTGIPYAFDMKAKIPNIHIYRTIVNTFLYKDE